MQKFCIWETGHKIPQIDYIKLRCKNSASGKLNTKYLKLTASSYSLSQNCRDTVVSSRPPNVGVHDLVTESQQTALGAGKRTAQEGKKTVFAFSVPTTAVFLSGTVGLSLESLRELKKKERKKRKKKQEF